MDMEGRYLFYPLTYLGCKIVTPVTNRRRYGGDQAHLCSCVSDMTGRHRFGERTASIEISMPWPEIAVCVYT